MEKKIIDKIEITEDNQNFSYNNKICHAHHGHHEMIKSKWFLQKKEYLIK